MVLGGDRGAGEKGTHVECVKGHDDQGPHTINMRLFWDKSVYCLREKKLDKVNHRVG